MAWPGHGGTKKERRFSPSAELWSPLTEVPNSLQSNNNAGREGARGHAETKNRKKGSNNANTTTTTNGHDYNDSPLRRPRNDSSRATARSSRDVDALPFDEYRPKRGAATAMRSGAASSSSTNKRLASDCSPSMPALFSSPKRKRSPLHRDNRSPTGLGLPSLASPAAAAAATAPRFRSRQQQQQHQQQQQPSRRRETDAPGHSRTQVPSLTSPEEPPFHSSQHQQSRHRKTNTNSIITRVSDSPPSAPSFSSGESDSKFPADEKTPILECADRASRRLAAAEATLAATSRISSSLTRIMGDSDAAADAARRTRAEAENAAAMAEGAARRVKEATDLAAEDERRASLELAEANARAEEARRSLARHGDAKRGRRSKQGDHGTGGDRRSKAPRKDTAAKPGPMGSVFRASYDVGAGTSRYPSTRKNAANPSSFHATKSTRIESVVEVCDVSDGTNSSSVTNHSLLLPTKKKAANPSPFQIETKRHKSEHKAAGRFELGIPPQPPMKMSSRPDTSSAEDALIEPIQTFRGHTSPITQIAAVDKNRFLSSSWDTTVRMWDASTGKCVRTFRGHGDWVHAIAVLDGGRRFLSGSDDRTVKLWDVDSDECVLTFRGHTSFVKALAPMDGDRFLSGSRDRTVKLFSTKGGGECLRTFEGHVNVVSALATLDSRHFVSGSHDGSIKYWNDAESTCVRTLAGHTGSIKTLAAVSKTEVVSGSDDKTIRLWDAAAGSCLREFGSKNSLVFSVTYICEGFFLSCGGNNIKLYHIPSGTCVKSYETPRISLAVVRLDDERFITGSDQTLHLWKF